MEEIQLANFEQNPCGVIDAIIHSHQPVVISDGEKFLVKIVPVSPPEHKSWLGCMRGKGGITGDIISPAADTDTWKIFSK